MIAPWVIGTQMREKLSEACLSKSEMRDFLVCRATAA
jgi:hypothetical protein